MPSTLRIATRKSPLALWQAEYVAQELKNYHPTLSIELIKLSTKGDEILDKSLSKIGGKGLFVKELELALFENQADIAVHSMKDVPMELPEGLEISTICERHDPSDALVSNNYKNLSELPKGAVLGTSSLRRQAQIKSLRPDLTVKPCRGNVGTRLDKLNNGEFDGIILASAGLERLELSHLIQQKFIPNEILPAVGQGAVGIECRRGDKVTQELLTPLNHSLTQIRVSAERAMNKKLNGSCQTPIAGHAVIKNNKLLLTGLVGRADGSEIIQAQYEGQCEDAENIGLIIAEDLLSQGADTILCDY